jgi:hypothetical protein
MLLRCISTVTSRSTASATAIKSAAMTAGCAARHCHRESVLRLPTRCACIGLQTDATPSGATSGCPRTRPDVQHSGGGLLRKNFRAGILRYVCNVAADSKRSRKALARITLDLSRRSLGIGIRLRTNNLRAWRPLPEGRPTALLQPAQPLAPARHLHTSWDINIILRASARSSADRVLA